MSTKSKFEKGVGFLKEEIGEMLGSTKMAQKGRNLRNQGKLEEGEAPKLTKPGTGHYE